MIEVMIIEDDPMVREINSKFLRKIEGFTLYQAVSNITEAKKAITSKKPDLILLDVFLPNENGIDLLRWIRKEEILVDVILITADKAINRVEEAFRYGAVDYLIKPFTFERFKEALFKFKERHYKFSENEYIEQNELDKLMLNKRLSEGEESYTKGFNKYTYKSIVKCIDSWDNEYFTSEEVAERLGIARVTVRKYLEFMEKEGKVSKLIEYGKIGRPQYKYKKI